MASGAAAAAAGAGTLTLVEGAAGTGKTAILEAARRFGRDAGSLSLRACCSELEHDFAFGAIRQLLAPAVAALSPAVRSELLAEAPLAAIAAVGSLGPADQRPGQAQEVMHGLHRLLSALSSSRPVQLLIDDGQWADLPSLRWLHYLMPRLEGVPAQVVVAIRTGETPSLPDHLCFPGTPRVPLRPLGRTSIARLAQARLAREVPDAFVDDCLHATGGNPLFLLALLDEVSRRDLDPAPGAVHDVGSALVARSIGRRLATLPPVATRYAEALAVLGNRRWPAVLQQMAAIDAATAQRSWSAMVDSGLLTTATDTGFVHPIVWASVRDGLAPSRRADLHAQSAALLRSAGATAEEIAAHVLRCPPGLIDFAVEPLRKAASSSWARGAPDVATTYLERALEEPLAATERQQVILALGSAEAAAGDVRAREHLTAAVELAPNAAARLAAAGALAKVLYSLGETRSAVTMLLAELDGTSDEPDRRQVEDVLFEMIDLDLSLRPRLSAGTPRDCPQTTLQHAHRAVVLTLAGVDRTGAHVSATAALQGDGLLDGHELYFLLVSFLMSQQDAYDHAVAAYSRAIDAADRRGSTVGTAVALAHRGRTRVYQGRLTDALADTRQAWKMAAASKWPALLQIVAEGHIQALLAIGDLAEAEQVLVDTPIDHPVRTTQDATGLIARGQVRSRRGDLHGALDDLFTGGRCLASWGLVNPAPYPWRSEAADVLRRLGRTQEAMDLAVEEVRMARHWGAPRGLGIALTTLGRLDPGHAVDGALFEAVAVLDGTGSELALAEALTELGAALRRSSQRDRSRQVLRRALSLAQHCAAAALTQRAYTELWATGARPAPLTRSGTSGLTSSERRVAELATTGQTNREIARDLFISVKTVETHLCSAYHKLGISTRAELGDRLTADASPPG